MSRLTQRSSPKAVKKQPLLSKTKTVQVALQLEKQLRSTKLIRSKTKKSLSKSPEVKSIQRPILNSKLLKKMPTSKNKSPKSSTNINK